MNDTIHDWLCCIYHIFTFKWKTDVEKVEIVNEEQFFLLVNFNELVEKSLYKYLSERINCLI